MQVTIRFETAEAMGAPARITNTLPIERASPAIRLALARSLRARGLPVTDPRLQEAELMAAQLAIADDEVIQGWKRLAGRS